MQRASWIILTLAFAGILNLKATADDGKKEKKDAAAAVAKVKKDTKSDKAKETAKPDKAAKSDKKRVADSEQRAEQRELFEKMRDKYAELKELRNAGKDEEADKVEAEIRTLRGKAMAGRAVPFGVARQAREVDPEQMKKRRELMEKLMAQYRKVRELKEAGKEEEAKAAHAELVEMREKMMKLGPGLFVAPQAFAGRQLSEEARKKFGDLREAMRKAEEAGDEKKLEELRKKSRQLMMQQFAGRRDSQRPKRPGASDDRKVTDRPKITYRVHPQGAQSPQMQLQRLRMAAANLDAAGMPEMAAKVRAEAEKIAAKLSEHARAAGDGSELRQHVRRLTDEVRRLREEVERLKKRD